MDKTSLLVLAINPGSTTTKLALFRAFEEIAVENNDHSVEELSRFETVYGQLKFRLALVESFLNTHGVHPGDLAAAMGRGGLLHPLPGGVYRVGDAMLRDLRMAVYGEHACNLGAPLAHAVALRYGCGAFIADPVVVDEMIDEARVSGMPEIERKSIFHALNQKYAARQAASLLGKRYEETRLIVAHLGGGVSVGSHRYGRVIDVNNALDGEGPFTPERSGGLPAGDLVRLSLSGKYTYDELRKRITGSGGLYAYWGSRDVRKLVEASEGGDAKALWILRSMVHQISKEIASHLAVLEGKVDAVVLTGGMANNAHMMEMIKSRVQTIAPVVVIPGEGEMVSLAENANAVLNGNREVMDYA